MATSGYFESDFNLSYHYPAKEGFYWGFRWTSTYKSPGVSTVNWVLYRRNTYEEKTTTSYVYLKINGTQKDIGLSSAQSIKFPNHGAGDGATWDSGSFDVSHGTNGAGSFSVEIGGRIYKGSGTQIIGTASRSFSLDANYPYSAAYWGNNSTVNLNKTYARPGSLDETSTITISWTGANGGTANPIDYYSIKIYENGQEVDTLTTEKSSITISFKNYPNRFAGGTVFTAEVAIVPDHNYVDGKWYNSEYKKASEICRMNRLPSISATNADESNNLKIASNAESFTIDFSTQDDDNDIVSIYLVDENSRLVEVNGDSYTGQISTEVSTQTMQFKAYDGFEYSEIISIGIVRGNPIVIERVVDIREEDGVVLMTFTNKGKEEVWLHTVILDENSIPLNMLSGESILPGKQLIKEYDIRNYYNGLEAGKTYKYRYWNIYISGAEESQSVGQDKIYSITVPNFKFKNEISNEYFTNPWFNEVLYINAENQNTSTEYTNTCWSYKISANSISKNPNIFDLNKNVLPTKGNSLTQVYFSNFEKPIKLSTYPTRIYDLLFNPKFVSNESYPNPFSPREYEFVWEIGDSFEKYGFQREKEYSPSIRVANGSNSQTITTKAEKEETKLSLKLTGVEMANLIGLTKDSPQGYRTVTFQISLSDDYGAEHDSAFIDIDFNFKKLVNVNSDFYYVVGSGTEDEIEFSLDIAKEGLKFYDRGVVYSVDSTINVWQQICYDYTETGPNKWDNLTTKPTSLNGTLTETSARDLNFTVDYYTYNLQKLDPIVFGPLVSSNKKIALRALCANYDPPNKVISYDTYYQRSPQAYISNAEWAEGENNTLTVTYEITDYGFDTTKTNLGKKLHFSFNNSNLSAESDLKNSGTYKFVFNHGKNNPFDGKDFVEVCPRVSITTWLEQRSGGNTIQYAEATHTFNSDVGFDLYNILPTMAYRKNCVGINLTDPETHSNNEAVMVISSYNNRNKLVFYCPSEGRTASINLSNGTQSGFIIDCGEWI